MKKKDLANINSKSISELENLANDLRLQINRAKMDMSMHRIKNTNAEKNLKKTLAQTLTFLKGKQYSKT